VPLDRPLGEALERDHPLSEQSIAEENCTMDFPDFTRGAWRKRKPIFGFDGTY